MNTTILACTTIREEILHVAEKNHIQDLRFQWIDSKLHDSPKLLHDELQRLIDAAPAGRILSGIGSCGNVWPGIVSGRHSLVIPRTEDCISLLLGGNRRRHGLEHDRTTYYMTEAWAGSKHSLYGDYLYSLKKYGKEMTEKIYGDMLAHYRYMGLVDTGITDIRALAARTAPAAKALLLRQICLAGTLDYIRLLLLGPWDKQHFIEIPPDTRITDQTDICALDCGGTCELS